MSCWSERKKEGYMTFAQASAKWQLGVPTIRKYIRSGKLPIVREGKGGKYIWIRDTAEKPRPEEFASTVYKKIEKSTEIPEGTSVTISTAMGEHVFMNIKSLTITPGSAKSMGIKLG